MRWAVVTYVYPNVWLLTFQSYLNAFAFATTVYTDLWDHLQQVSKDKIVKACRCLPLSWFCNARSVLRQLKAHQVFKSPTQSMTSWTAGLSRWVSQWLRLTPVQGGSPRNTSCWIQSLQWTGPPSLSMDLFHIGSIIWLVLVHTSN